MNFTLKGKKVTSSMIRTMQTLILSARDVKPLEIWRRVDS